MDLGRLPTSLPNLVLPHMPLSWETLRKAGVTVNLLAPVTYDDSNYV